MTDVETKTVQKIFRLASGRGGPQKIKSLKPAFGIQAAIRKYILFQRSFHNIYILFILDLPLPSDEPTTLLLSLVPPLQTLQAGLEITPGQTAHNT